MKKINADAKKSLERYDVCNSPFLDLQTPFTKWEAAKMACLIWLVPLRLFVGISALLVLACISYAAAFGQNINEPLKPWRRRLVVAGSKCAWVITLALGMRVRVEGYHHVAEAKRVGAMGIFNHTAWVDAILMMWLFAPSGVSLEKNARIPVVGTCIRAFQNIEVPSTSHGSAPKAKEGKSDGPSISDRIADRAKDRRFPILLMAPEGTCGDGRCILQFRSGSFLPGVPLLPILLQYDKSCHNPAWTIINEGWHFLRLVCQPYNSVVVRILPPYVPSEREMAQPRLFADNVRRLFSQELRLPLVEQTVIHYAALTKSGITVSLDGRRIEAPPGLVNAKGIADLSPYI